MVRYSAGGVWWSEKKLGGFVSGLESCDLVSLLKAAFAHKAMLDFFKQPVWLLGQRMQDLCLQVLGGGGASYSIAYDSFESALECPQVMDRKLVEYVEASNSFCRQARRRSYSCVADKASVGGLGSGLQTTVFVV